MWWRLLMKFCDWFLFEVCNGYYCVFLLGVCDWDGFGSVGNFSVLWISVIGWYDDFVLGWYWMVCVLCLYYVYLVFFDWWLLSYFWWDFIVLFFEYWLYLYCWYLSDCFVVFWWFVLLVYWCCVWLLCGGEWVVVLCDWCDCELVNCVLL